MNIKEKDPFYDFRTALRSKHTSLAKKQRLFEKEWIKEKKCKCVSTLRKGIVLRCVHFDKAFKKEFGEEEKKIKKMSLTLLKSELYLNPKFRHEWLQRFTF